MDEKKREVQPGATSRGLQGIVCSDVNGLARLGFMSEKSSSPGEVELARCALENVERPFPFHFTHLATDAADGGPLDPRTLHPVFGGSYDWHSSVHMHWSLVRLLNRALAGVAPYLASVSEAIVTRLDRAFTADNVAREVAYVERLGAASWERPYGWAWLVKLYAELAVCTHPNAAAWRGALVPLADRLADRLYDYLSRLPHPVRHGVHGNTAFAMILTLQFANTVGDTEFAAHVRERAGCFFGDDRDYRLAFDRSGEDFLSPALTEALLMSLVLPRTAFLDWFGRFLPEAEDPKHPFFASVAVGAGNETDARIAHLHGLNLSRAWAWRGLMQQLTPGEDARWQRFGEAAGAALAAAAPAVVGGDYVSTHWLVSFWLLAETEWSA